MYKKIISVLLTIIVLCATIIMPANATGEELQVTVVEKNLDTSVVNKITCSKNSAGETTADVIDTWIDEDNIQFDNVVNSNMLSNPLITPFSVVNPTDGRTVVQNTRMFPYSAIVELEIFFGTDRHGGTGFFVSDDVIATAAHCLYNKELGWATNVTVRPGRNGSLSLPYGLATAQTLSISIPYYEDPENNKDYDWGAIKLNPGIIGNPGQFTLTTVNDSTSTSDITARISGYPLYMAPNGSSDHKQYEMVGTGYTYSSRGLRFQIDVSSGQSGAPILNMNNQVIGILWGVSPSYSYATRMTDEVIYYLTDFIARHQ